MKRVTRLFSKTSDQDQLHLANVLRQETVGGVLMLAAMVAALLWANIAPEHYEAIAHLKLGPLSLAHWTADGLLAIFFFVAGLELRREFTEGALSTPSNALVPLIAASVGVAIPALLYVAFNLTMPGGKAAGWAIPAATDIAFALAVLAVVGRNLPSALRSFLLTMAIVDDVIAVLIIAIFFAKDLNFVALGGAVLCVGVWAFLQQRQIHHLWLYVPLGIATWYLTLLSGVHATIAGVVLGVLVYCSKDDPDDILDRWEHGLRPWSAGLVVPLFALFSAGVHLSGETVKALFTHPVSIGIIVGLVVGKLVGIFGATFVSGKLLDATPEGASWTEVAGIAQIAGIGFTVSLLIADLAFAKNPEMASLAKGAVLTASITAALLGGLILALRSRRRGNTSIPATASCSD